MECSSKPPAYALQLRTFMYKVCRRNCLMWENHIVLLVPCDIYHMAPTYCRKFHLNKTQGELRTNQKDTEACFLTASSTSNEFLSRMQLSILCAVGWFIFAYCAVARIRNMPCDSFLLYVSGTLQPRGCH